MHQGANKLLWRVCCLVCPIEWGEKDVFSQTVVGKIVSTVASVMIFDNDKIDRKIAAVAILAHKI